MQVTTIVWENILWQNIEKYLFEGVGKIKVDLLSGPD